MRYRDVTGAGLREVRFGKSILQQVDHAIRRVKFREICLRILEPRVLPRLRHVVRVDCCRYRIANWFAVTMSDLHILIIEDNEVMGLWVFFDRVE